MNIIKSPWCRNDNQRYENFLPFKSTQPKIQKLELICDLGVFFWSTLTYDPYKPEIFLSV